MNLVATKKHPYISEGVAITENGFRAQMLLDRGYAVEVAAAEKVVPISKPKTIKPKTIKK